MPNPSPPSPLYFFSYWSCKSLGIQVFIADYVGPENCQYSSDTFSLKYSQLMAYSFGHFPYLWIQLSFGSLFFIETRENRVTERFNSLFLRDHQVARPMDLYNKIDWAIFSLPRYLARVGPLCYSILSVETFKMVIMYTLHFLPKNGKIGKDAFLRGHNSLKL